MYQNRFSKDNTQPALRLLPGGCLRRGILLESEARECESGTTEQGHCTTTCRSQGVGKAAGQQSGTPGGREGQEPHTPLRSCPSETRGPSWQPAQPAHCLPGPHGPSASVVDVEVESLAAQQGVGVVKLEQVDALAGVVVTASLHVSVAVPPVHRHDLPVATPQGAPGASLHISNWDRVCMNRRAECLDTSSETTRKSYLKVREWSRCTSGVPPARCYRPPTGTWKCPGDPRVQEFWAPELPTPNANDASTAKQGLGFIEPT